tara:strand:+ start:179 stop:1456 length:1278 start_codon:yes stop_codon:yes gene_type:complete
MSATLTADVISTTYKKILFQKDDNKLYYTNGGGTADVEMTTLASPMTLSGLITASAGIKLGNNIIYASDGGAAITLDTSDNVTIGGDLTITGGNITNAITTDALLTATSGVKLGNNIIYNSEGTAALTLDTDEDLTITGDLKVSGGIIESATDGDLEVRSDGNISFYLDDDNDETGQKFYFYNDTTEIATLDESGNLQIDGELQTTKIAYTDGTDALTVNSGGSLTSAGLLTLGGNLVIPNGGNIGSATDTNAIAISSGGVVTFSQNIVQSGSNANTFAAKTTFSNGIIQAPLAATGTVNLEHTDSGEIVCVDTSAASCIINLPNSDVSGVNYKIMVVKVESGDATPNYDLTINGENNADFFFGGVAHVDIDNSNAVVRSNNTANYILTCTDVEVGTVIELVSDGTKWNVSGTVTGPTAPAFSGS